MTSTESKASTPTRALHVRLLDMTVRSVAVLAVLAVPLGSGVGPVLGTPSVAGTEREAATAWKASYSERYPGCVPTVLWPSDEQPVALVTRTPDGGVDRVALDPQRRPLHPFAPDARTIGVCR